MKIIKNNGYDRVVGYKWGLVLYWKHFNKREGGNEVFYLTIDLGMINRGLPVFFRRIYKSTRRPKLRNLPLLHLIIFPWLALIYLYFIVIAIIELIGVYVFYHVYDELITMPMNRKKLVYELTWTITAIVLLFFFLNS